MFQDLEKLDINQARTSCQRFPNEPNFRQVLGSGRLDVFRFLPLDQRGDERTALEVRLQEPLQIESGPTARRASISPFGVLRTPVPKLLWI